MTKFTYTFLIINCSLMTSFSQPGFNLLKDAGYDKNHLRDMIVVNDTIIGYGFGFDNPINGNQGVILVKFDSSGNLLKSNIILDPLGEPLSIDKHWGKITHTNDGGFAMTTATFGRESALLIKTDSELQVEFIKEYPDTVNLSNFQYSIVRAGEGFILYGAVQDTNFILRQFVQRVDQYGETLWRKFFGNPNFNAMIHDIRPIDDSMFIAGSYEATTPAFGGPFRSVVRIIDIDGNVIQAWESDVNPATGEVVELDMLEDGSVLCHGVAVVGSTMSEMDIVQPTLFKLDPDLNLLWVKKYGRTGLWGYQRWFRDMERTGDGHYIAAGESHVKINGDEIPSGWLMKFDTEGDSIWSRYDFPDFPLDSLGDTFFGGVGVLSSGSIVAGGTATLWNKRSIWLVKVTTDGCMEVIDCGLVPTFSTPKPTEKLTLQLSPNPTDAQVQVVWEADIKNAAIRLYDLQGHKVAQQQIQQGTQLAVFETGHLPAGVYFVEMRDGDGRFYREKLLVLH